MSIPYDVDPSLHAREPQEPSLDDGFSRPDSLIAMATHPVEPEPSGTEPGDGQPNPTHLPVEPEFAQPIPTDAEDPQPTHPAP